MSKVTLGLVQTAVSADLDANLEKAVERSIAAAKDGAQIICLQELFRGHYFCQIEDHKYFGWAESIPGQSEFAKSQIELLHRQVPLMVSTVHKPACCHFFICFTKSLSLPLFATFFDLFF